MDLPPAAASMYTPATWALVTYAAGARTPEGNYAFGVTDVSSAAAAIRGSLGLPGAFSAPGLSQLFSIARGMERSADALTTAADDARITPAMITEPPWSRPAEVQDTTPMYQVRAEITYRAPDGTVVTTWGTGIFANVLPTTVGAMRQELQLQLQRMLSQRDEQHNTGGELLGVGRTFILAV